MARIGIPRLERHGTQVAVAATVEWERRRRLPDELYVAVPQEHEDLLQPAVEAFLVGILTSAALHGEERITTGGQPVDPILLQGLEVFQAYHAAWYGRPVITVEAPAGLPDRTEVSARTSAAVFLSGGVDSLASLRMNARRYPREHPFRVSRALHVELKSPSLTGLAAHESALPARLATASLDEGARLVPVSTNLRTVEHDEFGPNWMWQAHGAVLAGVAHAVGRTFAAVHLASSYDFDHLVPWGSHPLTDPHLGTTRTRILHDGEQYSRLQKVCMLKGWTCGLAALDVCFHWDDRDPGAPPNCGRCEKCQRTMVELIACGIDPASTGTFRSPHVTVDTLGTVGRFVDQYQFDAWRDALRALDESGHPLRAPVARLLAMQRPILGLPQRATTEGRRWARRRLHRFRA